MAEEESGPRFKDGKSGLSHDRILVRLVNYTQIMLSFMALGGGIISAWWFSVQIVRFIDKTNQITQQVSILQQQNSRFEQLLVGHGAIRKIRSPTNDDADQ